MIAVLRNLAGIPDKKQERSNLHQKRKMQRGEAEVTETERRIQNSMIGFYFLLRSVSVISASPGCI
jgi:hypothetical protein